MDIIYICSPNNPTGAVYNREQLKKWVDYAISNNAIILFDSAYESLYQEMSFQEVFMKLRVLKLVQ